MDATSADDIPESAATPASFGLPEVESSIREWQQTGIARVGNLSLDLKKQVIAFTGNDMPLPYHVLEAGKSSESRAYTVWTNTFTLYVICHWVRGSQELEEATDDPAGALPQLKRIRFSGTRFLLLLSLSLHLKRAQGT